MINTLRKNILSLAACSAICTNIYAASNTQYVPLTTSADDNSWILFGVNGFSDGISSSGGSGDSFNPNGTTLTDTPADGVATAGLNPGGGDMAKLQALNLADNTAELSAITINVDISDVSFSPTEPTRVMYIDANEVTGVDLRFEYKASLEGKTLEMQIDGDTTKVYNVTINHQNTYSNPAKAIPSSVAAPSSQITKISDVIDYDLSNNPLNMGNYHTADHKDDVPLANARFYSYDSLTGSWKLWDRDNSAIANDFTDFEKGKAYWGKINDGDTDGTNSNNAAGLILGSSGNSSPDETIYDGKLNEGWNLISFDGIEPDIITATTGLLITASGGNDITITDSSGLHSVTISISAIANITDTNTVAKEINIAVQSAKGLGNLPKDMNLKAFAASSGQILLLSDKKFTLKDDNDAAITVVKTVAGKNPWDITTNTVAAVADLGATGVSSVYGEYMLLVEPLVGAGTASNLDNDVSGGGNAGSAAIQINGGDKIYLSDDVTADNVATLDTVISSIQSDEAFNGTDSNGAVTKLDYDFDDTADFLLLASDEKFYIKDHTFTRVHEFDGSDTLGTNNFTITSTTDAGNTRTATITPDATPTITEAVTAINALADSDAAVDDATDTEVYAYEDGSNIITISTSSPKLTLRDSATSTTGFLKDAAFGTTDIYKGAIKSVYSVNSIIENEITSSIYELNLGILITDGTWISLVVNGTDLDTDFSGDFTGPTNESDTTEKLALFDTIVTKFNQYFASNNINAFAKHDYTTSLNPASTAVNITIEGYGLTNAPGVESPDNTTYSFAIQNAATAEKLSSIGSPLTNDLKYNAVYTPNYVMDGPLYTLKEAGYNPKAIISSNTDLSTASIAWNNIDLTKDIDQWFTNNEYNLFKTSDYNGYWVYLEEYTNAPTIAFDTIVYNPKYKYSFNADGVTVNNIDEGTLTVEVSGLNSTEGKVYANVSGNELELTGSGTVYTGLITKYETLGLTANSGNPIGISLTASNGVGDTFTQTDVLSIDYDQPAAPAVNFSNGIATFSSTSTDVSSYYLYKDNVPETNTENSANKIEKIDSASAASYNICKYTTFNNSSNANSAVTYKVFAMDGSGTLGTANASDITTFTYLNYLAGASVLTNTYDGATETLLADVYDSTCQSTGSAVENTGVAIRTLTADSTVKLSYIANNDVSFDTNTPITTYVTAGGVTFQLKSLLTYGGDTYFVNNGTSVYKGTFPTDENSNVSDADPLDLGAALSNNNQTF